MNVLISSCVRWWNAEAEYAAVLGTALLEAGHRAWILTQSGTRNHQELERRGLPVLTHIPPAGAGPWRWMRAVRALRDFQRRESIQIVNVFRSAEWPLHLFAARGVPGLRIVRTRGSARPVRATRLNRWMYRQGCAGLIASSEAVATPLRNVLGIPPGQVHTIHFPADPPPMPDAQARALARRSLLTELGLEGERPLLGVVGRLYPEKGHARLLTAMERLVGSHPRVALVILAKNVAGEDPERPWLEAQVQGSGLAAHVRFLGFREDVRSLIGAMDVGVIPSIASEVNCRVAMEFFTQGVPVVAFPTGALPEVVEDGVSGLVTRSHDPTALAEALGRLLADEPTRLRLGEGARASTRDRFSRSRFLQETLAVFESALAAPGP